MTKSIQQFLQETTVPDHLQWKAENWDHHSEVDKDTQEKMNAALGGKSFVTFPLQTHQADADADVVEHLTNHGYSIKDYTKGIATIKKHVGDPSRGIPMREKHVEEKIGSVLEKTGAADHIKQAFANDPIRQSSKDSMQHHVVISTTPLAIAGMTTGTHWRNQSCMDMESGSNSHFLKHDSEHGTHVAFLVKHDDATAFKHGEPSNPIARIALKPFHTEESHSGLKPVDTIFRPETRAYGSGNSHFTHAVSKWANENYPAIEDEEYTKNTHVYDDSGEDTYRSYGKKHVERAIDEGNSIVDSRGDSIDHHVIEHAINYATKKYPNPEDSEHLRRVGARLSDIGNLSTQHVAKVFNMVKDHPSSVRNLAIYHGDKFSTNHINELAKHYELPNKVLMSPKLPDEYVDKLSPSQYSFVRKSKLKEHHYDKIVDEYVNDKSGSFYGLRDMFGGLNSRHHDRLINEGMSKNSGAAETITRLLAPHVNKDQHNAMVDKTLELVKSRQSTDGLRAANNIISTSKHTTFDDVDKFAKVLNDAKLKHSVYSKYAENGNLSSEDGKKLASKYMEGSNSTTDTFRTPAGFNGGHIDANISKYFTDADYDALASNGKRVAFADASHSNTFLDTIEEHAKMHDAALSEHLSKKMDEVDDYDEDEDETAQELKGKMHDTLQNYATNIDYHIDNHIHTTNDDGDGIISNHKEFQETRNRLARLGGLENYMTPQNSNRYDDTEHYDNWFSELDERMNDLETETERHENRDWD